MNSQWQLVNAESWEVVVPELRLAATFWTRFRGLQFQKNLPIGQGLLIAPCRSIHTHWMRFAIDLVMLDAQGVVLKLQQNLRPWRTCTGPPGTRFVLEVRAQTACLNEGDRLAIRWRDQNTEAPEVPLIESLVRRS
ncbi:MAG: DUF192 domain-containing protein [Fuerstiella sp.]